MHCRSRLSGIFPKTVQSLHHQLLISRVLLLSSDVSRRRERGEKRLRPQPYATRRENTYDLANNGKTEPGGGATGVLPPAHYFLFSLLSEL